MMTGRQKIIEEIKLRLASNLIDIELEPENYELAMELALDYYRMRSGNSLAESLFFMTLQTDVQTYTLPENIAEVREVYRSASLGVMDPLSLAWSQNTFMMTNPGNMGLGVSSSTSGTLSIYEISFDYQKLIGRMFGQHLQFIWNSATKQIIFERGFLAPEALLIHAYKERPEEELYKDRYARPWIRDYAMAQCKLMLGAAWSKYSSLAGPQGGITLNGGDLKNEALTDLTRLEEDIKRFVDQHVGMPIFYG